MIICLYIINVLFLQSRRVCLLRGKNWILNLGGSHLICLVSISGHSVRDLWWTTWHLGWFLSDYFGFFPVSIILQMHHIHTNSFPGCSYQKYRQLKSSNLPPAMPLRITRSTGMKKNLTSSSKNHLYLAECIPIYHNSNFTKMNTVMFSLPK